MSHTNLTEEQAERILVEQVNALAEHARQNGPAPDAAMRLEAIIARHRATIERLQAEERAETGEVLPIRTA